MKINYNNTIVSSVVDYITRMVESLTRYDEKQRKVKITNYQVASDESTDMYYYIKNNMSYEFNIIFEYQILSAEDQVIENGQFEISIPKMINNLFIIEGKRRTPTTVLGTDPDCRLVANKEGKYIIFDRQRRVYDGSVLKLEINIDWDERIVTEGTVENFTKYAEMLKLSQKQINKLKIKLDSDDVPEVITENLCRRLLELEIDKYKDSIVDKQFVNPENALLLNLSDGTKVRDIIKAMRSKFYQFGTIYITDIQNAINKYFRSANDSSIEVPTNVNPLVYNALSSKLILPKFIAYNNTFTDLIDPVNTPENNNVNRINEFNVCTVIEKGEPYILCYRFPTFDKIKVHYFEYLNASVVRNDFVDYDSKKLLPKEGKVIVKKRFHHIEVDSNSIENGMLIEPKADEKLSLTTRRIPLINMSDTVRVAMGAGMSKQAIELENAEPPIVSSGNDDDDKQFDTTRLYYEGEAGEIKKINEKTIYIKTNSGNIIPFEIPSTTVGLNNSIISYVVKVKVGDTVENGQELVSSYVTKDTSYNLGINANVAYMFYKGYNHEDAIIISDSFAKKCVGYQIIDVNVPILYDDTVQGILPIGTKVKSLDIIVNKASAIRMKESTRTAWKLPIMKFAHLDKAESYVKVPNSIEVGYILDYNLNVNSKWKELAEEGDNVGNAQKAIELLEEASTPKPNNILINDDIPERFWKMKLNTPDIENPDEEIATLSIRILKISYCKKGSKFCNRWGSKGEVSLVLPDDQMPTGEDGKPFDMLLNPPSVIKRKNPSQLMEVLLSKIKDKLYTLLRPLAEEGNILGIREKLNEFYGRQFDKVSDDDIINGLLKGDTILNFKVGSYSDYGRDKVLEMASKLEVTEKEYITDPDPEIGELEEPVITGKSYYMRLYHSSDYTAKVTSSIVDSKAPLMGRGFWREDGQKIGEMENWGLMAYGVDQLIRPNSLVREGIFLNELLLAGYSLEINGQPAILSSNFRKELPNK